MELERERGQGQRCPRHVDAARVATAACACRNESWRNLDAILMMVAMVVVVVERKAESS